MNFKHAASVFAVAVLAALSAVSASQEAPSPIARPSAALEFPMGTATPSELCGSCHQAIYREFAEGFGSDLLYKPMLYHSAEEPLLKLPAGASPNATLHALAGIDPFPTRARTVEEEGHSCNACHFPQAFTLPKMDQLEIPKPSGRPKHQESGGVTCAGCHLTPEGKIRGPYEVKAPHETVVEPKIRTSAMCALCHAQGRRVIGKQTQTFLEWREDFHNPWLGRQECQDCHMPRTVRKLAEGFEVPVRTVARHLWTGGHSSQRLRSALNLVIVQREERQPILEFHVINIGAGHSVPTGSNRRAVYLNAVVVDSSGKAVASREWVFAPWYGDRPDDRTFLEEDKKRPDAIAAMQADAQGPHEAPIRAGEERVLSWAPELAAGEYQLQASLIYDLNRYNERRFGEDQTEMYRSSLSITAKGGLQSSP